MVDGAHAQSAPLESLLWYAGRPVGMEGEVLYELRSYEIAPEKWDEYRAWATKLIWPLIERAGFRVVAFWEALPADDLGGDDSWSAHSIHWVVAWENEEERRAKWEELFASDAFRAAVAEATEPETGQLKYHRHRRITLLRAWPLSPLQ